MAQLNKQEQAQLKALLRADNWGVLEKYIAIYTGEINAQEITGTNAFETLRTLHTNQGKVNGMEELLERLTTEAFKD